MFRNLASQLTTGTSSSDKKKALSPTLRPDIYTLIDKTQAWIVGGGQSGHGQAGDGVSYNALLTPIQKHLPEQTKPLGVLESFGQLDSEIGVIVGGITNLILELSKWEGMSSGMAMRTWVDTLVDGYFRASSEARKELIAKGILRGLNQYTDATLLTKDFTTRIQIITCLKTVSSRIYGQGAMKPDRMRRCGVQSSSNSDFPVSDGSFLSDRIPNTFVFK